MDVQYSDNHQNTLWWITSLAISVVCCAILFVIFAGYVVNMKEDMAVSKMRYDMVDQRIGQMNTQLEMIYRHDVAQTGMAPTPAQSGMAPTPAQLAPAPNETLPAAMSPPPAAETSGPTPGTMTTPAGVVAPTTVTPSSASPTTVPEVPAK